MFYLDTPYLELCLLILIKFHLLVQYLPLPFSWLIQQTTNWWYFFFFSSPENRFLWRQFAWNVKSCFLGKIRKEKKNSKYRLLKILPRVLTLMCKGAVCHDFIHGHQQMGHPLKCQGLNLLEGNGYAYKRGNSIKSTFTPFRKVVSSRKHAYIILTPLNPTFI